MEIKLSLDNKAYSVKPGNGMIAILSKRIADCKANLDLEILSDRIGNRGHTFCPAIFKEGKRRSDHFEEMQLFALDFDSGVSFKDVKQTADRYELPISFAYYTFSSTTRLEKFRIIFLNDVPVTDRPSAEIIIQMLLKIFKEADKSCRDVSRMFFGGKGLIGNVKQDSINIVSLTESFQRYLFETQQKNYVREVHQFAKKNNIACVNNCLQISRICECDEVQEEIEDFSRIDPYIYGSKLEFPSNSPLYAISIHYQPDIRRKSLDLYEILQQDFKVIEQKCQLYHAFVKHPHIHHNERFLLMTNLLHISGGSKRFISIIEKKNYDRKKWKFFVKYAKDKGYKPQMCKGNCPYEGECHHVANMVNTVRQKERIIKIDKKETYYPVEEVYHSIYKCLNDAIEAPRQGIYLIPAQTAVGKTEAYCNLIANNTMRRFLIAVPTNNLKQEIKERLQKKGVKVTATLSLSEMLLAEEFKKIIFFYYQLGLGRNVIELLKNFINENKDTEEVDTIQTVNQCRDYIKSNNTLDKNRVIVTTQAKLLTLSPDIISQYTVIIDEDIISTIFKNIKTVSLQSVQALRYSPICPTLLKSRLEQILRMPEGGYAKFDGVSCFEDLSLQELTELEIFDDITEITVASVFQKDENSVHYFIPQLVPEGKYIVLSATSNIDLYRSYFFDRYIKEYPYNRAKYKGRLKQLSSYSMSRQCIQNCKKELELFLASLTPDYHLITFMKYEEEFGASGLHFGNAEGVDSLNGKNVLLLGTPHLNEFVYKLIGCHLDMDIDSGVLAVRKIQYMEYEFSFMTYKNEELRNLQIYFISKELEQCIGRARLLRNDCTVLVLSNFPCEQAELIQEDYFDEEFSEQLRLACSPDLAGE